MVLQSRANVLSSIPFDILLKIASLLEVVDISVLSCCSRFWHEVCGSDALWEPLARNRWPTYSFLNVSSSASSRWRNVYIANHSEMAARALIVVQFVQKFSPSGTMEVKDYYKAVEDLSKENLSFEDIQLFLFKPELSVLTNLVEQLMDVLVKCGISEKVICVKWWKFGRWSYGFRMRDELHCRQCSLADLGTDQGEEVLGVLKRGAVHEVFRVEISSAKTASTSWFGQSTQIW